jgi:hypothetical protein
MKHIYRDGTRIGNLGGLNLYVKFVCPKGKKNFAQTLRLCRYLCKLQKKNRRRSNCAKEEQTKKQLFIKINSSEWICGPYEASGLTTEY